MSASVLKRRPSLQDLEVFKQISSHAEQTAQILEKKIEWSKYKDSNHIDAEELGLILQYDTHNAEEQADLLNEQGTIYAKLFVKLLTSIHAVEPNKYLLALVDELLRADPSRAEFFAQLESKEQLDPYEPFQKHLLRGADEYTSSASASVLSILLSAKGVSPQSTHVQDFLDWLMKKLTSSKGAELLTVAQSLKTVLKSPGAQAAFLAQGGVKSLTSLLKKETQNTQLLYYVVFCFWLLSFSKDSADAIRDEDVIVKLVDVLKASPRKKVVRMAFAFLHNLLDVGDLKDDMITSGLLKILPNLAQRKWGDDDLVNDVTTVQSVLLEYVVTLSSVEKYQAELHSGHLQWSPVHNDSFFRQNIARFEDNNFTFVRELLGLLDADNPVTVEVACYDLGEFARFHPDGRRLLSRNKGKTKLMEKMTHPNAKVAKQALLAVQKLMVHHWESLTS